YIFADASRTATDESPLRAIFPETLKSGPDGRACGTIARVGAYRARQLTKQNDGSRGRTSPHPFNDTQRPASYNFNLWTDK
ncbi:MAG: hypothetical protein ACRYGL_03940, partial [Janthinobacterium lividum]